MRIVTPCLVGIAASLVVGAMTATAEEVRPALVVVPSFQAELPDGTPVYAIVVVPAENVLHKNAAWLAWEQQWPTRYRIKSSDETLEKVP